MPADTDLRERLGHVRWLGGSTGAGKSTVAGRIAGSDGIRIYDTDASIAVHLARSSPATHPLMHAFAAMDIDERWLNRPVDEMLRSFHGFQGEGFEMIIEDLLELPASTPILAEGFRLLPRLVAPLLSRATQAAWLVTTPAFRRHAFEARGQAWHGSQRTSDSERSFDNLLARDALFNDAVAREARDLGLTVIDVAGDIDVNTVVDSVREALGLKPG